MKKSNGSQRLGILGMSILLLTGFTSCDDQYLSQANRLSKNAEKLEIIFPEQASDYIESCYRAANYVSIQPANKDPFSARKDYLEDCKKDKEIIEGAKQAFIAENLVVSKYLIAIGNLAQDENFVLLGTDEKAKLETIINTYLGNDPTNLSSVSQINAGTAFSTIISFIYEQAAKKYSSDEIKAEVIRINPQLQTIICAFKGGWSRTYGNSLDTEENKINAFYKDMISNVIQKSSKDLELTALEVQKLRSELYQTRPNEQNVLVNYTAYPEIYTYDKQWQNELNTLQQRRSALTKYIGILNEIASGHAALEQASGGKGQGQETYCNSEYRLLNDNQVNPKQINAYLTHIEKLLIELETLQAASKK